MKIDFEDINKIIEEFKVPYRLAPCSEVNELLEKMEEENVSPFEYIHYLYREWNPTLVVKSVICSEKAWKAFMNFRKIRMAETAIRVDIEKHRLQFLLKKDISIQDIITSELETFFCLLKYILAGASELDDLIELYQPGAEYELKIMPELKKHLFEFGDRFFPKI